MAATTAAAAAALTSASSSSAAAGGGSVPGMPHGSGPNGAAAAATAAPTAGAPPAGQATSGGPAVAPHRPSSPPRSSTTTTTTGLLDIEKELTCSICTDTLYQPLTLLDCLHTFCGSCLKLWFAWLASQADADPDADAGRLRNPYTCPSCRAHVRGTRPDAKITTLLDMYLAANPGKGKSEEEKAEMREKYSPGDNVVPRLTESWDEICERRRSELDQRSAARRAHGGGYQRGLRHHAAPRRGEEGGDGSEDGRAQHLGHQSSLRSLMSMDDSIDSEEMEAEIMRQIVEEGLLEGINVDDLTSEQHEELAERIANAYRRRQEDRIRSRRRSPDNEDRRRDSSRRRDTSRHRDSSRRTNASRRQDSPSAPARRSTDVATRRTPAGSPAVSSPPSPSRSPVRSARRSHANSTSEAHGPQIPPQREDLLQAYPADTRRRRRSSDSRRQTAPVANTASRSATDLSIRPDNSSRPSPTGRVGSGSGSEVSSHRLVLRDSPLSRSPHGSPVHSPPQSPPILGPNRTSSSRTNSLTAASMAPSVVPLEHTINQSPTVVSVSNANYHHSASVTAPSQHGRTGSFSNSMPGVSRLQGFSEIVISCDSCKRRGIQYEVHHNCQSCRGGKFNLCDRCYKIGRGCENWYGFGHAAWQRYQAKGAPSPQLPHVLLAVQYRRPEPDELADGSTEARPLTKGLAQKRKRVGAYCYGCSAYAEDFFYRCERCNDGEWGFCRDCVNQGRCCTHDLLPVAGVATGRNETSAADAARGVHATFAHHISDPAAMIQPFPPSTTNTSRLYRPLTVTTTCDRCRRPIAPNDPRFHCPRCNDGTLELCSPCYAALEDAGTIAPHDGSGGWRRCPRRHRMIVLVYADSGAGPRRVVLNDLVGGHFLKDEQDRDASPDGTDESSSSAAAAATTATTNTTTTGSAAAAAATTDPADALHKERRYDWQDGDTGLRSTTTLSRPKATAAGLVVDGSSSGGGGGGGGSSSNSSPKFPPDGGVGKRCVARWSWIPELGVANELMFPKGAEVTEVLDVNNKWCEGSYAGAKGVFPTNYVKVLDFVTM